MRRLLIGLFALLLLGSLAAAGEDPTGKVTELADAYVNEFVSRFPEAAQFSGLPDVPLDRLTDNSREAIQEWHQLEDRWSQELDQLDAMELWGKPEWITHGFLREVIDASRGLRICRQELWPVNQMSGWQTFVSQLISMQPVDTPEQRKAALERWSQFSRYLKNEIDNAREGTETGYTSPRRTVELVVGQVEGLLALSFEESPFAEPLARTEDPGFRERWTALVKEEILPAIGSYHDFLKNEYIGKARETQAITGIPDGEQCYRASFRSYTTIDRSPKETFDLGDRTVKTNVSEALEIGRKAFPDITDTESLLKFLENDVSDRFKTREELLQFSRDTVKRAHKAMPTWFGEVPKAEVVVEPHPEFLEAAVSSQYEPAPADGSRSAIYRIRLYKPEEQKRSLAEIVAFHETWPGHHLQIAIAQQKQESHPITRLVYNSGFVEGWARYSEALAEEAGLYSSKNGLVARRMWPARGMVIDPGLHLMGWTREQAIEFVLAAGRTRSQAEQLVDRVAVLPAQLTAYDTGGLEIRALREKAESALGKSFDIRKFHDVLLGNGSVTLPMLRQIIDRWIQEHLQPLAGNGES